MDATTPSSLSYLATEAFALNIIKGRISHLFEELLLSDIENTCGASENQNCKSITQKIASSLCTYLPEELIDAVASRMYRMISEIHMWLRAHYQVINHIERRHCLESLCWFPDGAVDRTKTAFLLIQNESIDISVRFVIACDYFFQMDVVLLWQAMTEREREMVPNIDINQSVQFWVTLMRKTTKSQSWTQRMKNYLGIGRKPPLIRR